MLDTNDVAKIYDTILSIPGMNEMAKIDMKISRKNALLINSVIKRLDPKPDKKTFSLLSSMPDETLAELNTIAAEYLNKSGLTELNEKLDLLGGGH